MAEEKRYASIDLKSFYASVECVERGLDPLIANLVVADESRTEKTICLAVSPSMKALGLGGRCRLFEVTQKIHETEKRTGKKVDCIIAPPRMRKYIEYSTRIYEKVYLRYLSGEDVHVYSVDEVMADLTGYLKMYGMNARELTATLIRAVYDETGITATAGIGTNLYLSKVAMDILAKHEEPDDNGVRIAELDERSYREKLWGHRPITDFWRVGPGTARKLEKRGIRTMGDICRRSVYDEEALFTDFGVDAELLIDHAWGLESCTMADIKNYRPEDRSLSVGQVLPGPYDAEKGRIVVWEMAERLSCELLSGGLVCGSVSVTIGYDREGMPEHWAGPMEKDRYGRLSPAMTHASSPVTDLGGALIRSNSARKLTEAAMRAYDRAIRRELKVRRFFVVFDRVEKADEEGNGLPRQMDLFTSDEDLEKEMEMDGKEEKMNRAVIGLRSRFGPNAVLRGKNLMEGATGAQRSLQIGGHRAGEDE